MSFCSISFTAANPVAQQWAATESAQLITQALFDTKEGLRHTIARAFTEGIPPRQLAPLLKMQIGLTEKYSEAVGNLRAALQSSPGKLVYAGKRRIRVPGGGMPAELIEKHCKKYADRLLRLRAERIARTETMAAANEGQRQLWEQAIKDGVLPEDSVRVWITTPDDRLCDICDAQSGTEAPVDMPYEGREGTINSGESWLNPPAHPSCRCIQIIQRRGQKRNPQAVPTAPRAREIGVRPKAVPKGRERTVAPTKEPRAALGKSFRRVEVANSKMVPLYETELARIQQRCPKLTGMQVDSLHVANSKFVVDPYSMAQRKSIGVYNKYNDAIHVAGRASFAGESIGFSVDPSVAGAFRHEFGHHVKVMELGYAQGTKQMAKVQREWTQKVWKPLSASKGISRSVSKYASANSDELFAEAFCKYTGRDYKAGQLPASIEKFFAKYLG